MVAVLRGAVKGKYSLSVRTKHLVAYVVDIKGDEAVVVDLIARLKGALYATAAKPRSIHVLKEVKKARGEMENYMYVLEDALGIISTEVRTMVPRKPRTGPPKGSGLGYSVYLPSGRTVWECRLTTTQFGKGKYIGSRPTKKEADQLGRETLAQLRADSV